MNIQAKVEMEGTHNEHWGWLLDLGTIIDFLALTLASISFSWLVFRDLYKLTENIVFIPEKKYELEIDPESSYNRGTILLFFRNTGRQMGFAILQGASCPKLDPYLEFSVFFEKEGPQGSTGFLEKREEKIGSIDALSGRWANLTFESRENEIFDATENQQPYRKLPPDLLDTIPLTLHYKVTKKRGYIEMHNEISLHIKKQKKSPIFSL